MSSNSTLGGFSQAIIQVDTFSPPVEPQTKQLETDNLDHDEPSLSLAGLSLNHGEPGYRTHEKSPSKSRKGPPSQGPPLCCLHLFPQHLSWPTGTWRWYIPSFSTHVYPEYQRMWGEGSGQYSRHSLFLGNSIGRCVRHTELNMISRSLPFVHYPVEREPLLLRPDGIGSVISHFYLRERRLVWTHVRQLWLIQILRRVQKNKVMP